jgi:DNA-binding beta-propeller fold protein YncE
VLRIDPRSGRTEEARPVGAEPAAVALSGDSVWVANSAEDTVTRLAR